MDDKNYELSLNKTSDEKISVEIKSDKSSFNSDVVDIIPLSDNKFRAILPSGEEKIYLINSGDVIEISNTNETVDIFSPKNNDNINLDNFTISLYICALFIMIFMDVHLVMGSTD